MGRTCSEEGDAFNVRDVGRCVGGCGYAKGEPAASGQRAADSGTEGRRQDLQTCLSHRVRVTGPCPAAWPDEPLGGSRVLPEGSRDPRPGREPRTPWTASPRRSEGEATCRRSSNGRPQKQQRVAGGQQAAAGRCERERMGQIANASHEKQPVNSYLL